MAVDTAVPLRTSDTPSLSDAGLPRSASPRQLSVRVRSPSAGPSPALAIPCRAAARRTAVRRAGTHTQSPRSDGGRARSRGGAPVSDEGEGPEDDEMLLVEGDDEDNISAREDDDASEEDSGEQREQRDVDDEEEDGEDSDGRRQRRGLARRTATPVRHDRLTFAHLQAVRGCGCFSVPWPCWCLSRARMRRAVAHVAFVCVCSHATRARAGVPPAHHRGRPPAGHWRHSAQEGVPPLQRACPRPGPLAAPRLPCRVCGCSSMTPHQLHRLHVCLACRRLSAGRSASSTAWRS